MGRSRWTSCLDMMCDSVFGVLSRGLGLCEKGEISEDVSKLIGGSSWEDRRAGCGSRGRNDTLYLELSEGVHEACVSC